MKLYDYEAKGRRFEDLTATVAGYNRLRMQVEQTVGAIVVTGAKHEGYITGTDVEGRVYISPTHMNPNPSEANVDIPTNGPPDVKRQM